MDKYRNELDLIAKIEEKFGPTISSCFPYEWNEDHITFSMLKSIRKDFSSFAFWGWGLRESVNWSAYKYSGKLENKYGDIGVLVKLVYRDGRVLEGIGFVEAKRRYQGKLTFDALKIPQLRRIKKNFPHSYLLLYDYEPITGFIGNHALAPSESPLNTSYKGLASQPFTHALAVQTHTALATTAKDQSLYKHGIPFSHLLVNRYFNGLDLEFDEEILNHVKGFNSDRGFVSYLIEATVYEPGARIDEEPQINRNMYEEL